MPEVFIGVPIEYDETQLYQTAITRIQERYPGWTPGNGTKIDMLLRLCAYMAAIAAETASTVDVDIFRYFGGLANIPPNPPVNASTAATFTVRDDAGYEIPAFTPVALKSAAIDTPVTFETVEDLTILPGGTVGTTGIVASDAGADGNNRDTVIRADSLQFVTSITVALPSSGGRDSETTQDYIDRLARELGLWSRTPIRGPEFAIRAQTIPSIYRCAAWENYNPADETTDNERYVTLCPIDEGGNAVSSGVKSDLADLIESLREIGFIGPIVDPAFSTIDITYTAHASVGTSAAVKAQILSALADFLNPATWGAPRISGRTIPIWINTPKVRLNKIIQVIEDVGIVDWAEPVTIGVHGGSLAASDITMSGAFPLPRLGTVTATIDFS